MRLLHRGKLDKWTAMHMAAEILVLSVRKEGKDISSEI